MANKILETLNKADSVQPIAEKDGIQIVTYEDHVALAQAELVANNKDMGERQMNPDGSIAKSKRKSAAVNVDVLLDNRYRKIKGGKIQIINDYRAMKEQESGRIYSKTILAYQISRNKSTNQLQLDETVLIPSDVFVNEFTHKLNNKSMMEILPVIQENAGSVTEDELSI